MSIKLSCCLCCTPCMEYKPLQNDYGECNEIYEITVKYFDPMLLTEYINSISCTKESRVLCHDCWMHIKDFDDFHQTVINSRRTLQQSNLQKSPLQIKIEEEQIDVDLNDEYEVAYYDNGESDSKNISIKNYAQNDLNPIDEDFKIDDNDEYEDCDEMPLIELKRKENVLQHNEDNKKVTEDKKVKESSKTRRRRKSKGSSQGGTNLKLNDVDDSLPTNPEKTEDIMMQKNKYLSKAALEKARESNEFIAEWKSQLECDICNETFAIYDLLNIHFKNKHKIRCYVKCCERKFFRRSYLVDHIRMHIDPEKYKCDICGKQSSNKYNLKLHKKTVHEGVKQYGCHQCDKTFKQKPNLERHLLTHITGSKDFKCEECGRSYVLEVQLKSHVKLVHSDNRICDQCGKTLHSPGALKQHLKEHDGTEKPTFPCDECGTILRSRVSLKKHIAAYHNDGTTVYVCSICGKVAGSERGLINHRKYVHEKERIHKCPHCDKAFKRPKSLVEHIATHTGEDLYQCPHCPRAFKISSKYHEHRKKVHPVEWEETRKNRLERQKIDFEKVRTQITL